MIHPAIETLSSQLNLALPKPSINILICSLINGKCAKGNLV